MAKPLTAADPSIEDMLSTIRQAIDEESAKSSQGPGQNAGVSGSMREMRVSLQPAGDSKQGTVAARSDDFMNTRPASQPSGATTRVTGAGKPFGGIMGGDVRLEEALSRMQRAGERQEPNMASRPSSQPALPTQPAPSTRPAAPAGAGSFRQSVDQALRTAHLGLDRDANLHRPAPDPAPIASPQPAEDGIGTAQRKPQYAPSVSLPVMSQDSSKAAADAFNRLSEELLLRSVGGSDQLASTARDMIRPLLKAWLDENLPGLVEKLVREEIERVVRRGGH